MALELIAAKRVEQGTGASRRLRHAGQTPAVIYGGEKAPEAVTVDHNTVFYALKDEAFHTSVIDLIVDGAKEPVLVRDFQMHPYKQQVMHVDFQRVNMNEKVHVRVPLHYVNADVSPAVKLHGGRLSYILNEVEVRALPAALPNFIEVDLSAAIGGQTIHLSDVKLPEGVESVSLLRGEDLAIASASGKVKAE